MGGLRKKRNLPCMYRRIAEAARLEKRGEAGLWRNPQLQRALDWRTRTKPTPAWAERYDPDFEVAMDFLDRSVEEHKAEVEREEEARRREEKAAGLKKPQEDLCLHGGRHRRRLAVFALLVDEEPEVCYVKVWHAVWLPMPPCLTGRTMPQSRRASSQLLLATESMRRIESLENEEALRLDLALLPKEISHSRGEGQVNAVTFSPDGRYVATASDDGTATCDRGSYGNEVSHLKHDGEVKAIALSPDGRYVAIVGADDTARVDRGRNGEGNLASEARRQGQRNRLQSRWPVYGHGERGRYSKYSYL